VSSSRLFASDLCAILQRGFASEISNSDDVERALTFVHRKVDKLKKCAWTALLFRLSSHALTCRIRFAFEQTKTKVFALASHCP